MTRADALKEFLDSERFDGLMAAYRTAPASRPQFVIERFEAVKLAIWESQFPDQQPEAVPQPEME